MTELTWLQASNQALDRIKTAMTEPPYISNFTYSKRDVMLYNIGIGATHNQLPFI